MSHEVSETIETPQGWQNVFGRSTPQAGQPLTPVYDFEHLFYPDRAMAESAADQRSKLYDTPIGRLLYLLMRKPRSPINPNLP